MNIALMTTHLNAGGITSYLYTLCQGLIRGGHSVFLISSGGEREDDFNSLGVRVLNLNIKTKSELDLKIYQAILPIVKFVKENKIDVIHAHTRITQVMGRLIQGRTAVAFVSTCHGFFKRRLSRRLAPCWGDRVIAISPAVKDHLMMDFDVKKEIIDVVENGIDGSQFILLSPEEKLQRRKELGLPSNPLIGNIARLSDVKGQDILIQAMPQILNKIPDSKLLIIGQGREEKKLKQIVAALKIESKVQFILQTKDIIKYMSILDVFVMPSRHEGLGLSIMEAQASGIAVIGTKVGGIPTLIKDGQTGVLIPPENREALAEAAIHLLEDPKLANSLGRSSREYILSHFSANRMVEHTCGTYQLVTKKAE